MSFVNARRAGVVALVALVSTQAFAEGDNGDRPVATVNGEAILSGELQLMVGTLFAKRKPERRSDIDEAQRIAREMLIANVAQAQEAVKLGLDKDPGVVAVLAYQRAGTLARAYQRAMLKRDPVTEERAAAEYARAMKDGKVQEFRLAHIVVARKEIAAEIIAELKRGEKFADLARLRSLDPNATKNDGEIGWTRVDLMDEYGFVDAVSALKPGQYTPEPVQGATGWHVLKLLEAPRPLPGSQPYAELPKEAKEKLKQRALTRQSNQIEAAALASAKVSRAEDLRAFDPVESAVTSQPAPATAAPVSP